MKTLIISDGKPGHVNQARALCGIMGWQSLETIPAYPFHAAKGLTYLLDWAHVSSMKLFTLTTAAGGGEFTPTQATFDFEVITAVGSASYYPAKVIGRRWGVPVIALMYPRGFRMDFARILCPAYDYPPRRDTITTLPITLSNRNRSFYDEMTADFGTKFSYSLPAVSVIIGGDNKYGKIQPETMQRQLARIFELTPNHQHWVTTSRRTCPEVEKVVEGFPFDYRLIFSKEQYNPIPAFITLSEYVFVTSDSSSMISECVSTGSAKVEVLKNASPKKSKFDRFLELLEGDGCIHVFEGSLGHADKKISLENEIKAALAGIETQRQNGRAVR